MIVLISDADFTLKREEFDVEFIQVKSKKGLYYLNELKKAAIRDKEPEFRPEVCLDVEATDLDAFVSKILLIQIGNENIQIIIHWPSIKDTTHYFNALNSICNTFTITGHNVKYDFKILKAQTGLDIKYPYDTMIVEQRLYKGLDIKYGLEELVKRYKGFIPTEMNESITNTFIRANPKTWIPRSIQIKYSAMDIKHLPFIKRHQEIAIARYGQERLIYEIEMPLIRVLGKMENEGLVLRVGKLRELYKANIQRQFELEQELDDELRMLRDGVDDFEREIFRNPIIEQKDRIYLLGGKFDRKRTQQTIKQKDLFDVGFEEEKDASDSSAYINYSSPAQIINILGRLRQPVPTEDGNYGMVIFNAKGKVANDYMSFTTNEKIFNQYLIELPDSPVRTWIELLFKYREVTGNINKYGEEFTKKLNPVTGRIHTIYRQCFAENGRFQSGGGKREPDKFQSQNIPVEGGYKELFGFDPGYSLMTIDMSGAEVTIMADKAKDQKIFDLTMKGDIHAYMATLGWRNIYKARGELKEAESYIISKKINEDKRRSGKNLTFGSIYGAGKKKAGKTIGVSPDEGAIYLNTIKREVPKVFKLVERNVEIALKQGYIVFNERTNSRLWFKEIRTAVKEARSLSWEEQDSVAGKARNCPISGTQADMIKEAIVEIDAELERQNLDAGLLLQVHDELVVYMRKEYDGQSDEFKANPKFVSYKGEQMILPELISKMLIEICNRYLSFIKMGAEYKIADTWIK